MGDLSRSLLRLRPVTFRYTQPFADGEKPVQFGLIAEEVAEVMPELVARDANGQPETVKYQLLAPMLLNEVQKQQRTIEAQVQQIAAQAAEIESQAGQLADLQARLIRLETLSRQVSSAGLSVENPNVSVAHEPDPGSNALSFH